MPGTGWRSHPAPRHPRSRYGFQGNGPDAEGARFVAATVDGIRAISVYAPNGRALGTPFYAAKLDWYEQLLDWLEQNANPSEPLVLGGDLNIAPTDIDVYDPAVYVGTTHTSDAERKRIRAAARLGPDRGVPALPSGTRQVHLVGLPSRQLP